jgi:hypothetical protein
MRVSTDFRLLKQKKVDETTTLKVSKNLMSGRIFVEFVSDNPRIVLQKNFQDTILGKVESDRFAKSINSTEELREYFGIKKVTV